MNTDKRKQEFIHAHEATVAAWNRFASDLRDQEAYELYRRCDTLRIVCAKQLILLYNTAALELLGDEGKLYTSLCLERYRAFEYWISNPTCANAHDKYLDVVGKLEAQTYELALIICKLV